MLYGDESKKQLDKYVEQLIIKSPEVNNRKKRRLLYDELKERFNMTVNLADEILTFKKDMAYFTPYELFCVLACLEPNSLGKFFTEKEIAKLLKQKFKLLKATLPISFNNMVQISDDQWIGKTSLLEIMALRNAQLFNYDENEQRAMKRIIYGDSELFKPFVNRKSVDAIQDCMMEGRYVPDTITLNMPDGSEFFFEDNVLTVKSLPDGMFNLDDGFHRVLAMSRIHDFNPNFDYPMELRIVNFSNTKANTFIYQQDQKNKMKKIVSDTYDSGSVVNKIVMRLNEDPGSNIQGMIGRNDAKIDSGVLAKLIGYFFIKGKPKKEEEMRVVISVKTDLLNKFNALTEQDESFFEAYSDERLMITMAVFASGIKPAKYAKTIKAIENGLTEEDIKVFNVSTSGVIRRKAIDLISEGINNV